MLPGFVDTHRHTWQTAMRGICADWTLLDYFRGIRLQISTAFGPEDVYAGNYVGALEALDSGVTTLLDFSHCMNSPDHADEAVRGLADAGVRGILAYGMFPVPLEQPAFPAPADRLADARRVRERYFSSGDELLDMGIALTELGLVPFDVTRAEVALARELDVMVTAHTGSVTSDRRLPEVELLHGAGLLDHRQVHVHCNACTDHELDLLAGAGASVSLTPETELQMGMGFPIFAARPGAGTRPLPGLRHRLEQPRGSVRPDASRAPGRAGPRESAHAGFTRDAGGADTRRAGRAALRDAGRRGGARDGLGGRIDRPWEGGGPRPGALRSPQHGAR